MRQVVIVPDERMAKRLTDHLLTLEISTRVDKSDKGWIVWVHREDKMDQAKREVESFLADPENPRYEGVSKVAQVVRKQTAKKQREHLKNSVNLSGRLNVPSLERCPVTYGLIAMSVAVAILTGVGEKRRINQLFMLSPIISSAETDPAGVGSKKSGERKSQFQLTGLSQLAKGQVWRLITPIFLHFGPIHLLFNMIMLYRIGGLIELRKGKLLMALLVLGTGIFSNLAEYFWDLQLHGPDDPIQFGGMSGVVYALFGYAWMKSDYDPEVDIKIPTDMIVQMILWLLLCMSGMLGPIANAAHVAGLFSGLLIGVAPYLWYWWR